MNLEVTMTLEEAVDEVLALLTGIDLSYQPELDRFYVVARQLNRALRANALENEWSYYSSTEDIGLSVAGVATYNFRSSLRPRIITDDAVRLVDESGQPRVWAYYLARDALSKYAHREGLWASYTRTTLQFSRPLFQGEGGLRIHVPAMREPRMFRLPKQPRDTQNPLVTVPDDVLQQSVDFDYPDVVILRAAFYVAQSDPVMQPRVQGLEEQYKGLMYQLIERDTRATDNSYLNEFNVPMEGSLSPAYYSPMMHGHPHSDERR